MVAFVTVDNLYRDETDANAQLMRAAPELLESLVDLVDRVDLVLYAGFVGFDRIAKARAAIAKATRAGFSPGYSPTEIALAFRKEMQRQLSHDNLVEIDSRNRQELDQRICHSHDFTDANQVLLDALARLSEEGMTVPTSDDVDLLGQAWMLARSMGFSES